MADGLEIEQRMLAIDENEVVAGGLGDARDVAGAPQPHRHAERDAAGLHLLLDRVCELVRGRHDATPILSSLEHGLFRSPVPTLGLVPGACFSESCDLRPPGRAAGRRPAPRTIARQATSRCAPRV